MNPSDWLKNQRPNDYDCKCKRCPHCGGKEPNTFYPQPAPAYPYYPVQVPTYVHSSGTVVLKPGESITY